MTDETSASKDSRIQWHRTKIDKEQLKALNKRSDRKGLVQSCGHLLLLLATGSLAVGSAGVWPWWVTLLIVWIHGTFWTFLLNGFHELIHGTVFKSKKLNQCFLNIYSFLGQYNPIMFWASHTEHHKYTLHPPRDLEVILPIEFSVKGFLQSAFFNPMGILFNLKMHGRHSVGSLLGEWQNMLFPDNEAKKKKQLVNWARTILVGHALLLIGSVTMAVITQSPRWAVVPFVTTLAPYFGGWLLFLLNNTQHVGLTDEVPDFRLCCRTIRVNPFFEFLYWNMNYHIEHHMYAGVPCYNLKKMHRAIAHELPYCPRGLYETWRDILLILKRQKQDPSYQFTPVVPNPLHGEKSCSPSVSPDQQAAAA